MKTIADLKNKNSFMAFVNERYLEICAISGKQKWDEYKVSSAISGYRKGKVVPAATPGALAKAARRLRCTADEVAMAAYGMTVGQIQDMKAELTRERRRAFRQTEDARRRARERGRSESARENHRNWVRRCRAEGKNSRGKKPRSQRANDMFECAVAKERMSQEEFSEWYKSRRKEQKFAAAHNRRVRRKLGTSADKKLMTKTRISLFIRQAGVCSYCGGPMFLGAGRNNQRGASVDHIVPLVAGGTHDACNMTLCCKRCNSTKRDLDLIQFADAYRHVIPDDVIVAYAREMRRIHAAG